MGSDSLLHLCMQAYQKKKEVGELKGDVKPPGPLETFAEIIEEDGVLVGALTACAWQSLTGHTTQGWHQCAWSLHRHARGFEHWRYVH